MNRSLNKHCIVMGWIALIGLIICGLASPRAASASAGPCSATTIHQGLITADESWCAGDTHYLLGDVTVQFGVTLTIQAGVTISTPVNGWGTYLTIKGHMDVNGTLAQPVLMTVADSNGTRLEWGGLMFDGSDGDGSGTISYTTIEYAATNLGGYGGAVHAVLAKDLPAGKAVNIDHSTIRHNRGKGVYIVNSTVNLTNNTFTQNSYPVFIEGAASVVSYANNTFTGNAYGYPNINYPILEDGIFIAPDAMMDHNFDLPAQAGLDAYVFFSGTTIPAGRTVTVPPGTIVRTGNREGNCQIIVQGNLDAVGTAGQPIRFTGVPKSGSALTDIETWHGMVFDGRSGAGTGHLAYVTLEKAGDNFTEYGSYGLLVRDTPALSQVLLENSVIQDHINLGIRVVNGNLTMNNSTVQNNPQAMLITGAASKVPLTGNTFSGNLYNYVYIDPDAMSGNNFSLNRQSGLDAYYFTGTYTIPTGKTLQVQPGVTVRTAANKYLIVQGDLQALGTTALPIRFSDPAANNAVWGGLIFDGPSGASGHLDHTIVEHGCDWWNGQGCANVIIYNLAANKSVIVEQSVLQNSNFYGLRVINSPTAQVNGNLISGGQYGAYFATSMTVSNLALLNQNLDGIWVETGFSLDARHLTIANAGRWGFNILTGAAGSLKNSILSHNALAVKTDGNGTATLDTNLSDTNATFKSGTVTDLNTLSGSAMFDVDGYHIQPGSSAVGKAMRGLTLVDIDGDARPWPAGSLPDLGADEISAGLFQVFLPSLRR